MSLRVANRMFVVTSSGEREIQLCLGDITALPKEEQVDVIMISAFPNNYSATSGSVVGALKRNLNLDVEELAYNHKKEDLRQNFHCWISKELPEHLPYRQLICFEKFRRLKTASHLDLAVRDVFRAMMPIFNNENKSVITPLLATGSQTARKQKMLHGMLNAAIEWMKFGLPLQLLRIVIYGESVEMRNELQAIFEDIRSRAELDRHPPKDPPIRNDVFLIYAKDDEDTANEMKNFLATAKRHFLKYLGPAKVITATDVASKKSSWQHDIIMAMLSSSSVVPVLTTSFMSDPSCLDQYNLALCANRRTKRNLLAPFCLDAVSDMPIYMTLVQWFNCKPRDSVKIQNSCIVLMEQMKESFETVKVEYDVFVSYCHKNLDKAKVFVNSLKRENSEMQIFFDQDELKAGQSWQQALYRALDNAKCVIALISDDYLESVVCNEELNVASAKHLSTAKSQELILIQLEETKKIPLFDHVQPIAASGNYNDVAKALASSVATWLHSGTKDNVFSPIEYPIDIQDLTEKWRRQDLERNYFLSQDGIYLNDMAFNMSKRRSDRNDDPIIYDSKSAEKATNDVFISYSLQDRRYASFLAWSLARSPSNFSICSLSSSEANDTTQVDLARCVVVLLSLHYHRNPKKVEEFSYILSRARKNRVIYVVFVDALPTRPWYLRVVHCSTALTDDFWPDALASLTNSTKDGMIFSPELNSAKAKIEKHQGPVLSREALALLKATCDIENICLAVRNRKRPAVEMQKGIFFNIVDLKQSLDVQNSHKREFTTVASDYGKKNRDAAAAAADGRGDHHWSRDQQQPHPGPGHPGPGHPGPGHHGPGIEVPSPRHTTNARADAFLQPGIDVGMPNRHHGDDGHDVTLSHHHGDRFPDETVHTPEQKIHYSDLYSPEQKFYPPEQNSRSPEQKFKPPQQNPRSPEQVFPSSDQGGHSPDQRDQRPDRRDRSPDRRMSPDHPDYSPPHQQPVAQVSGGYPQAYPNGSFPQTHTLQNPNSNNWEGSNNYPDNRRHQEIPHDRRPDDLQKEKKKSSKTCTLL